MLSSRSVKKFFFLLAFFFLSLASPLWAGLRVGIVLPLSGEASSQGQALKDWLQTAANALPSRIDLFFYDSSGKCSRLSQIVERAYWDGVNVLVGPFLSRCSEEFVSRVRSWGIPAIVTSGDFHPVKEWGKNLGPYFRTGLSTRAAVKVLYRCLKKKGQKKIGLLLTRDPVGKEAERWLMAYAVEYGLKIQKKRYFGLHDTDVSYHLEALLECEAVICWAPRETLARVARNLASLNFGLPVYFPHLVAEEDFLRKNQGLSGQAFVGAALLAGNIPFSQKWSRLYEDWRRKRNFPRDLLFFAYTDALIFLDAGWRRGRHRWVQGLEKAGLVKGLTGLYFLSTDDHYGLIPASVGVFRYQGRDYVFVCPPSKSIF